MTSPTSQVAEWLDVMEKQDASGSELIAARQAIESAFSKLREENSEIQRDAWRQWENWKEETESKLDASRNALRACFGEYDRLFGEWEAANDWQREREKMMLQSVGAMAIAEEQEGWQLIPIDCPMLGAVFALRVHVQRLQKFETYVCQAIAMGNQADLTVEELPK